MKKSEEIELAAMQEESDHKAWTLHFQAARQRRWEFFTETLLPVIKDSPHVNYVTEFAYHFKIAFTDGIEVDYYPKKDRMLYTKQAKWIYNGFGELQKMV